MWSPWIMKRERISLSATEYVTHTHSQDWWLCVVLGCTVRSSASPLCLLLLYWTDTDRPAVPHRPIVYKHVCCQPVINPVVCQSETSLRNSSVKVTGRFIVLLKKNQCTGWMEGAAVDRFHQQREQTKMAFYRVNKRRHFKLGVEWVWTCSISSGRCKSKS